jgi:phenylacetate-CoA ligase
MSTSPAKQAAQDFTGLRIGLVGPLPPPAGGIANQTVQLAALLRGAGASVALVQTNRPVPRPVAALRGLRALWRLPGYLWRLWRCAGQNELLHVMANSGWSWHLHAAPAIWIARLRGRGVLVNYRGGQAQHFLEGHRRLVLATLRRADAVLVPSGFLRDVFERHGLMTQVVPNIIDLDRFRPDPAGPAIGQRAPQVLVARHLEPLYDNATALRALVLLRKVVPEARMVLCGSGHEESRLRALAAELLPPAAVRFAGHTGRDAMAQLYRQSAAVLNPTLADNLPNSVLEALASGVPVVSTNVGGVPYLLKHQHTGLLVPPGDAAAMARALAQLLRDPASAHRQATAGLALARQFGWPQVAPVLAAQYRRVRLRPRPSPITRLVAGLLFPLHEWLKGHDSVACRHALEQSQWLPREHIETAQLARLRTLLMQVQRQVPYYRQLFSRLDFHPERVHDLRDLRCLPLLRKSDIRAHSASFKSDYAGRLKRGNTGGSSGEPLIFYLGKDRISHDVAAKWRATRWWGVDIGDPEVVLWGSPIELTAQDRWRGLRDRLLRTTLLPAFALSAEHLDRYLAQLRRLRPAMLFGYPSALCHLVRHAKSRGIALDRNGVRIVFVTAERLYDEQRTLLQSAFGCPVANGYGGRDAGFIAHECPEGGMHVSAEDIIVEIVDSRGQPVADGVSGEIVVTHLASADFPFIRYATGDVGALDPQPCRCGRGLPLLRQIEGRVTDFVVAQDGTVMHGLALIYVLRDLPTVQAFKIVQESLALTRIELVCLDLLSPSLRANIVAQFRGRLGNAVEILIEEVAQIAPEASGKHRHVISKIASSH